MSFSVTTIDGNVEQLCDQQIYRYMGMKAVPQDGQLRELVETLKPSFLNTLQCKGCYGVVPVAVNGNHVDLSVFSVTSMDLARNLKDCQSAVLFAATLGMASEQQRRRAAAVSPVKALALDAMGSAAIEAFCNQIASALARELHPLRLRPRFSPGYGDFSLEFQPLMLRVLDARRKIGISLSDGMLMIPQKSVTAVIGVSGSGCLKEIADCECCERTACEFRL